MSSAAMELEPWIIVLGEGAEASLALWKIGGRDDDSLAMFSDENLAQEYADRHYALPWQTRQLERVALIRVLADCYQNGLRFATLNPSATAARQLFVLKDVLKSARASLGSGEF